MLADGLFVFRELRYTFLGIQFNRDADRRTQEDALRYGFNQQLIVGFEAISPTKSRRNGDDAAFIDNGLGLHVSSIAEILKTRNRSSVGGSTRSDRGVHSVLHTIYGRLAQLVRAPALQAGGRWFEPGIAHHCEGPLDSLSRGPFSV